MILDSSAMIGPTAGEGVVGTVTAAHGTDDGWILVDSGSTQMACGPANFPHVAPRPGRFIARQTFHYYCQKVVQTISPETGENVQKHHGCCGRRW